MRIIDDPSVYTGHSGGYNMEAMELELEGGSFEASGNIEVTLPDFMVMLTNEELAEARRAVQRDQMLIAAGCRPDSDEIVVMTATCRLFTLSGDKHTLPRGKVFPIDCGHTLAIDCGEDGLFEVAADWLIENATPLDLALLT